MADARVDVGTLFPVVLAAPADRVIAAQKSKLRFQGMLTVRKNSQQSLAVTQILR